VLEIGTGSGYAVAILAQLATHVYTIERHRELAQVAQERFAAMGLTNIRSGSAPTTARSRPPTSGTARCT
jgi:protein-L-isoaspartate O-methyltransferase